MIGAIYILAREYFDSQAETREEENEGINHEIERDEKLAQKSPENRKLAQ